MFPKAKPGARTEALFSIWRQTEETFKGWLGDGKTAQIEESVGVRRYTIIEGTKVKDPVIVRILFFRIGYHRVDDLEIFGNLAEAARNRQASFQAAVGECNGQRTVKAENRVRCSVLFGIPYYFRII